MKTTKLKNGRVEEITTSFMAKEPYTYFAAWHRFNGVGFFDHFEDAVMFVSERQLSINF